MEINSMTFDDIETRSKEIEELLKSDDADVDALETEIAQLEERKAILTAEFEERKKQVEEVLDIKETIETFEKEEVRKTMEINELRNTPEYIDAYAEYLKGNEKEIRALLTENASGQVAVPELVYGIVKTAWEREGLMSRVRKAYIKGNLKVGFEISASGAVIHTEGADRIGEETLLLGTVQLTPQSIKKWISISDEAYDLRGREFLEYIYDELTYQIAKKCADEMVAKIIACGTVSTTTCPSVPVLNDNPAIDTIAQAMAMLSDEAQNPVIIMNKATWGAFKTAQYGASYPIDPFENLPVVFNNSLTASAVATTGVTYAIVGDLGEGALANFPNGEEITLKFDDLSLAQKDMIKITARQYVGLGVVAPQAFVKITKE